MIGFAAHLRVYQPLAAFTDPQRSHWTAYADSPDVPSRPVLMAREHDIALAAAARTPPRLDAGIADEQAYVRHLDGLTYVCPWRLPQRIWEAAADFRMRLPDEIADAFIPLPAAQVAERAYEEWVAEHADDPIPIQSSTWQVPVPWFVLFEAEERRLVLGERQVSAATTSGGVAQAGLDRALVYLTAMSRARRRCGKARGVVRRTLGDGPALDALEEVGRWLELFHPHSLVELDYGGLVHLLDDDELSGDTSVADVAEALEALASADGERAGDRYDRVSGRWRALGALEHAN